MRDRKLSISKKQLLELLPGNTGNIVLKGSASCSSLLPEHQGFRSIWLKPGDEQELTNISQVVAYCFGEEAPVTVVCFKDGILLLIEGNVLKKEVRDIARQVRDTVNSEAYIDVDIGISEKNFHSGRLREAFARARESIKIGKKFHPQNHIFFYEELKLEKMLLMISQEEREKIYDELFWNEKYDYIQEEMHKTIEALLKNDLNMGETAKELFIHRNTLSYRLDKINKDLGLNLREPADVMYYKMGRLLKKSFLG